MLCKVQETVFACLKPSFIIIDMLVPMLCVGTHTRNTLRSKTAKLGRRAPRLAFTSSVACGSCPRRTVGTRKQKPKQPLKVGERSERKKNSVSPILRLSDSPALRFSGSPIHALGSLYFRNGLIPNLIKECVIARSRRRRGNLPNTGNVA